MDADSNGVGEVKRVLVEVHRRRRRQRRLTFCRGAVALRAFAGLLMGVTAERNASFDVIETMSSMDSCDRCSGPTMSACTRRVCKRLPVELLLGRTQSRNVMLQLLDGAGQPRLQLQVTPKGEATLSFLDGHADIARVSSAEQH
ncbi:hypothetical protein QEG26_001128 [Stenotrophomonas maltophilia]|nr:hypothetical protein [Stenotrophomonas maltophilia]